MQAERTEQQIHSRLEELPLFAAAQPPPCSPPAPTPQPARDLPAELHQVLTYITTHARGQAQAVTAEQIAVALGLQPDGSRGPGGSRARAVRALLELHWHDIDAPIVADSSGIYLAATADEITHYHRNLYGRLKAIAGRIAGHRRHATAAGYTYLGRGRYTAVDS